MTIDDEHEKQNDNRRCVFVAAFFWLSFCTIPSTRCAVLQ
jgi:hypothetical protein